MQAQIAALRYKYAVLEQRLARQLQRQRLDDIEVKRIKTAQLRLREQLEELRHGRQEVRRRIVR